MLLLYTLVDFIQLLKLIQPIQGDWASQKRYMVVTDSNGEGMCAVSPAPLHVLERTQHLGECLMACGEKTDCFSYTYHFDTTRCELGCEPSNYEIVPNCFTYLWTDAFSCADEFFSQNCQNGGLCRRECKNYTCICLPGYFGRNCNTSLFVVRGPNTCPNSAGSNDIDFYSVEGEGTILNVSCSLSTPIGWLVFQRRVDAIVDFYRNWNSYRDGFGDLTGSFWIGNENLHTITTSGVYKLRVDIRSWVDEPKYAEYSTFSVGSAATRYTITIGGYSGDAGDGMINMYNPVNGKPFQTYDSDTTTSGCAAAFHGAWWYNNCHEACLNGIYYPSSIGVLGKGIDWFPWGGHEYSHKFAQMQISRIG